MSWESDTAERTREEAVLNERRRRTLAELLRARGNVIAAGIVAGSECQLELVDNWDGGQYQLVLAVPADVFDLIDDVTRDELSDAAEVIVGLDHYAGSACSHPACRVARRVGSRAYRDPALDGA